MGRKIKLSVCFMQTNIVWHKFVEIDISLYYYFSFDYLGENCWRLFGTRPCEYLGIETLDIIPSYYCETNEVAAFIVQVNSYMSRSCIVCGVREFTNSCNNIGFYTELMRLLSKVKMIVFESLQRYSLRCYKRNGTDYFVKLDITKICDISRVYELGEEKFAKIHISYFNGRLLILYVDLTDYEILLQRWSAFRREKDSFGFITEDDLPPF